MKHKNQWISYQLKLHDAYKACEVRFKSIQKTSVEPYRKMSGSIKLVAKVSDWHNPKEYTLKDAVKTLSKQGTALEMYSSNSVTCVYLDWEHTVLKPYDEGLVTLAREQVTRQVSCLIDAVKHHANTMESPISDIVPLALANGSRQISYKKLDGTDVVATKLSFHGCIWLVSCQVAHIPFFWEGADAMFSVENLLATIDDAKERPERVAPSYSVDMNVYPADGDHLLRAVNQVKDAQMKHGHGSTPLTPLEYPVEYHIIQNTGMAKYTIAAPDAWVNASVKQQQVTNEVTYNTGELERIVPFLPSHLAEDYIPWMKTCMKIMSVAKSADMDARQCLDLCHQFSRTVPDAYDEKSVTKALPKMWKNAVADAGYFGSLVNSLKETEAGQDEWIRVLNDRNKEYAFVPDTLEQEHDATIHGISDLDELIQVSQSLSYDEVKEVFEKFCAKVMEPICLAELKHGRVVLVSMADAKEKFVNMKYAHVTFDDVGKVQTRKPEPFFCRWRMDSTIKTYRRCDFLPPPLEVPHGVLNLWRGFAVSHIPIELGQSEEAQAGLQLILNHIQVVAGNSEEDSHNASVDFITDWLAHMFQLPGEKVRCMILVQGKKRTGKDVLPEELLKPMVGHELYYQTADVITEVLAKHADSMMGTILMTLDELFSRDTYSISSKWKNMITATVWSHEPKGLKRVSYNHFVRFWGTANELNSIPEMDDSEARVFMTSIDDRYRGKSAYFRPLVAACKKPGVQRAFYDYLMSRDLSGRDFDDLESRPVTDVQRDVQGCNMDYELAWIAHWAANNYNMSDDGVIVVTPSEMWKQFAKCTKPEEMAKINYRVAQFAPKERTFLIKMKHNKYPGVVWDRSHGMNRYIITVPTLLSYMDGFGYDLRSVAGIIP